MWPDTSRVTLIWLDAGYACGGVVLDQAGRVTDAAPIFRWMKGKTWRHIQKHHRRRIRRWQVVKTRTGNV